MAFQGFPKDTVPFLRDLTENNTKEWFDENRDRYESSYMEPAKAFVKAIGPRLTELSPTVQAEAKVNKSIFRVNRDTRFSKDKTPYKNHIDMMFWDGEGRSRDCAGFFFRLTPQSVHLGAGKHMFAKSELALFRDAIASDDGAGVEAAIAAAQKQGLQAGGSHYKRVPSGYDADHPRAELLKYNALWAFQELPHPDSLNDASFIDFCVERFAASAPLLFWVRDNVVEAAKS